MFFYPVQLFFHVPSPFVIWRNMNRSFSEEVEFVIFPNSFILQFAPIWYSSSIGLTMVNKYV